MSFDSEFLYHEPCSSCGSSDANSVYSDGHSYCFSCGNYIKNAREEEERIIKDMNLLNHVTQPLNSRKLTKKTCDFYNYGIGTFFDQKSGQKFPAQVADYHYKGKIVAQHVRLPDKDFRWVGDSKKVELWGQNLFPKGGRILVITEGEIDAMSIYQVSDGKIAAVSIPSGAKSADSALKRNSEYINSFGKVILAFDKDDDGKDALEKAILILPVGKVYVPKWGNAKDANELLQKGEGVRLVQSIYTAEPYRPDEILAGNELWDAFNEELPPGLSIPYKQLNEKLEGMRTSTITMLTAGSGIGKTTFGRELLYHMMMEHKQPVGVISLEENKRKTTKYWAGLYLNKAIHTDSRFRAISQEDRQRAFEATINNGRFWLYDHWGSHQIDTLIAKIRYMAVALGVKWILLDHVSIVVSGLDNEIGDSERQMIDRLMTRLRELVDSTDIGIIAIVHLKRKGGGDNGKSYNEGREVSLTDLRGSGALEQLPDTVVALERNQQGDNPHVANIRVLKNREIGKTGPAGSTIYCEFTGRMTHYEGEVKGAFKGGNVKDEFDKDNKDF